MAPGPSFTARTSNSTDMPELSIDANVAGQASAVSGGSSGSSLANNITSAAPGESSQHKWCALCGCIVEPAPGDQVGNNDGIAGSTEAGGALHVSGTAGSAGTSSSLSNVTAGGNLAASSASSSSIQAATAAQAAPSPSSIAFAPPGSAASSLAQVLLQQGAAMAASANQDLGVRSHVDDQGRPICHTCYHSRQGPAPHDPRGGSSAAGAASRHRDAGTSTIAEQPMEADHQREPSPVAPHTQADRRGPHVPSPTQSSRSLSTSRTSPSRPWLQGARAHQSTASQIITEAPEDGRASAFPPLSVAMSVSPMRSRSHSGGEGHIQEAVDPTQVEHSGPRHGSSSMARSSSFSRSQIANSLDLDAADSLNNAAQQQPLVNFSRTRTHSVGSATSSARGRSRQSSSARRMSRSGSSSGVGSSTSNTQSFAAAIIAAAGTLSHDVPIDPSRFPVDPRYTPSAMTRPRLSTQAISRRLPESTDPNQPPLHLQRPNPLAAPYSIKRRRDARAEQGSSRRTWEETFYFDPEKLDPLQDVSLRRLPSRGIGCLYPGALFTGTQKSGRSTYDVSVQIVNVNLEASTLCGYLNIRGLTEDWPELTTYFDAEIIGLKHGFMTRKWGATEADDYKHWSRFAPFRPLKHSLTKPDLHFNHLNKPFVFMRWKERFLVPDHRVRERDINGASYAGFYYVCVELGDEATRHRRNQEAGRTSPSVSPEGRRERRLSFTEATYNTGYWRAVSPVSPVSRREPDVTVDAMMMDGSDEARPTQESNVAITGSSGRMSGYYFHENSEPYQQLSLSHVPERSSSSFELR